MLNDSSKDYLIQVSKLYKHIIKREEVEERHQQKKRRIQARITECWAKLPDTRKRMIEVEQVKTSVS